MADKCLASPNTPPRHWWVATRGHGGGIALTCAFCRKRTSYRRDIPLGGNRKEYEGYQRGSGYEEAQRKSEELAPR